MTFEDTHTKMAYHVCIHYIQPTPSLLELHRLKVKPKLIGQPFMYVHLEKLWSQLNLSTNFSIESICKNREEDHDASTHMLKPLINKPWHPINKAIFHPPSSFHSFLIWFSKYDLHDISIRHGVPQLTTIHINFLELHGS